MKLSEQIKNCLDGSGCGECEFWEEETISVCSGLLQASYERIKGYENIEEAETRNKFKRNIPQELSYIKELAKSCENETSKNNIITACDNVLKMCNDIFNGYCRENLELYERLETLQKMNEMEGKE